jgi:hypothetical protein
MKLPKKTRPSNQIFWVTNISKTIVSLTDLGLCIQPLRTVNLLDNQHYSLSKEQLLASSISGSLFKKRDKIIVRKVPPGPQPKTFIPHQEDAIFPTKHHSAVQMEDIKYEELNVSDDDYANENTETAQEDQLGRYKK